MRRSRTATTARLTLVHGQPDPVGDVLTVHRADHVEAEIRRHLDELLRCRWLFADAARLRAAATVLGEAVPVAEALARLAAAGTGRQGQLSMRAGSSTSADRAAGL